MKWYSFTLFVEKPRFFNSLHIHSYTYTQWTIGLLCVMLTHFLQACIRSFLLSSIFPITYMLNDCNCFLFVFCLYFIVNVNAYLFYFHMMFQFVASFIFLIQKVNIQAINSKRTEITNSSDHCNEWPVHEQEAFWKIWDWKMITMCVSEVWFF